MDFPLLYIAKIISYAYLYELLGSEVHDYMDVEPSGLPFNAPEFNADKKPHNPLVTSGAVMVCFLLRKQKKGIEDIMQFFQKATQCKKMKIDETLYRDHKTRGYTTHAMASLMLAKRAFCKNQFEEVTKAQADDALDLYFQLCSIVSNVESLARFGAMLANDGVNPSNGHRVLMAKTV